MFLKTLLFMLADLGPQNFGDILELIRELYTKGNLSIELLSNELNKNLDELLDLGLIQSSSSGDYKLTSRGWTRLNSLRRQGMVGEIKRKPSSKFEEEFPNLF